MFDTGLIEIFRGDDTDGLGYQTINGVVDTDLDLTGCTLTFRYLDFVQTFTGVSSGDTLTITMSSAVTKTFPPGLGFASVRVTDSDRKLRTFNNRIPVIVKTSTPCVGGGQFHICFKKFPELEPLKIFTGGTSYTEYTGYIQRIIDKATASQFGLVELYDGIDSTEGASTGKAATPAAVNAVIQKLTDEYYNADDIDEKLADKLESVVVSELPSEGDSNTIYLVQTTVSSVYDSFMWIDGAWGRIGSSSGGTSDYAALSNKPQINGTTLQSGNNTLYGSSLAVSATDATTVDAALSALDDKVDETALLRKYYPIGDVSSLSQITTTGLEYTYDDATHTATLSNGLSATGDVVVPYEVEHEGAMYAVTAIGVYAFYDSNDSVGARVTSLVAPITVTSIGNLAFYSCSSLASISLPSATNIGENAFYYCTNLASVLLPSATSIGESAFIGCEDLASVDFGTMPRTISLGTEALLYVPTSCRILLPMGAYTAAWQALKTEGYDVRCYADVADIPTIGTTLAHNTTTAVTGGTIWSHIWGALTAIPDSAASLYAWITAKLGLKADKTQLGIAPWTASTAYAVGAILAYNGAVYRCIAATTAGILPTNTTYWASDGFLPKSGGTMTGNLRVGTIVIDATDESINGANGLDSATSYIPGSDNASSFPDWTLARKMDTRYAIVALGSSTSLTNAASNTDIAAAITTAKTYTLPAPVVDASNNRQVRDLYLYANVGTNGSVTFASTDAAGNSLTFVSDDFSALAAEDGLNAWLLSEVAANTFLVKRLALTTGTL